MKVPIMKYKKEVCSHCQQTTTYALKINKGLVDLLMAFANAVKIRGNDIVATKIICPTRITDRITRMERGWITDVQYSNLSHLRYHGLIASIGTNRYCLTSKGASFLRGEEVEAVAIVNKAQKMNIGYLADDNGKIYRTNMKTVFKGKDGYWDGWDYEIVNGQLIRRTPQPALF